MPESRRLLLPLLFALLVLRLWLMPLPSSFWLDETGTIFVAQHGSQHPSLNDVAPQAWRSWYYPLIHVWGMLFGFSEAATRIPSVLAMLIGLALIARLSRRLVHPESAWFAAFACFALFGINYQAANARPYAFGMCLFAAALLFLVRWFDSSAWLDALLFAGCAASVLYIHLLFWPSCLVFPLYAGVRISLHKTAVGWGRASVVFALLGVTIVPAVAETLDLLREAPAHVISRPPSIFQFERSLQLPVIVGCAAGAWLAARLRKWPPADPNHSSPAIVLIAAWWLCQPVALFSFSWLTGDSIFLTRYLQLALPGAALAATAAASYFIPSGHWRSLSPVVGLAALLYFGEWRQLWPRHHNSDWRAAAAAVNRQQANRAVPVICPSPFIEARPPAWRPDYPLPGFLYAHLATYPLRAKAYLFPFASSPEAESYAAALAKDALAESQRFLIYGWQPQVDLWREWFAHRTEFAGWNVRRLGPFEDEDVVEFADPAGDRQ